MTYPPTKLGFSVLSFQVRLNKLIFLLGIFSLACIASDKEKPVVRFIENDWASQAVMTHIAAQLLRRFGYDTTTILVTSDEQWGLFKYAKADVQLELWEGTMRAMFERMQKRKLVIDIGNHKATTREEWWYPNYVEKQCPGLPDWKALKKCWKIFIHQETAPLGRYLSGPWEKPDAARIRALGLRFRVKRTSEQGLIDALIQAHKTQQPIVLFNWSPNWLQLKYPGTFVEFPKWSRECEQDPSWGINPDLSYDCGNPQSGWLKKIVHADFYSASPCAVAVLKKISFDDKALENFFLQAQEGKNTIAIAEEWLSLNPATWKQWIKVDCKAEISN